MNVRFLQVAKLDLDATVAYYNRERAGLGYELLWEVFFWHRAHQAVPAGVGPVS